MKTKTPIESRPLAKPEDVVPPPSSPKVMFEITSHISVGGRFLAYMRELELLAGEAEGYVEVLGENPDARAIKYVHDRLKERLARIYAASKVDT